METNMDNQDNVAEQNAPQIESIPTEHSYNFWAILPIILIAILALGGGLMFYNLKKQNVPQPEPYLTAQPSSSTTTEQAQIFPVKVYGAQMDTDIMEVQGGPAPCQPESFDLSDDSSKEGLTEVTLPEPFSLTTYNFGCLSSISSVLDLIKNEERQALYTHVLHYSVSDDGKKLFLVNNIDNQGTWTLHKRIINIETNEANEIPNIKCVSELDGFWQGDRLITYAEDVDNTDYHTDICVWDTSAKLISRIGATTAWGAASRNFLAEKIGLLPTDPDVFYAYTGKDTNTCSLFLANLTNSETKSIEILDKGNYPENYYCAEPNVEFDFSELYFDQGILKYRIEKDKQTSGETTWGDWQTSSIN